MAFKKMNPEVKTKWIAALRSGDYKQGKNKLRSDTNHFCCLGVLCNIHAQEHPEIAAKETDPIRYMGKMSYPHDEVLAWAGVVKAPGESAYKLSFMNDRGTSFEVIANWIEENL